MNYSEFPLELELALLQIAAKAFSNNRCKLSYTIKDNTIYIKFIAICNSVTLREKELFKNPIFIICLIPIYEYLIICRRRHDNYFTLSYKPDNFDWESMDSINDVEYALDETERKCIEDFAVELYPILLRYFSALATSIEV